MKLAKIQRGDAVAPAIIEDTMAYLIGPWVTGAADELPFEACGWSPDQLADLRANARSGIPFAEVTLAMPASPTTKFVCLGLNYRNHVEETHNDLPQNPTLFTKFGDALVGHEQPILRPRVSEHFDYEGEISIVIGKPCRYVSVEDAMSYVFGYTIMLDGSVRDFQKHSPSAGKNFPRSGSLGPWIVTADEIPDPSQLALETVLNGQQVQSTTAAMMLYDIPTVIAYVSQWTALAPGDVIATGTPGGVGARRTPPLWMKQGDVIEVSVSGIGTLRNPVENEG